MEKKQSPQSPATSQRIPWWVSILLAIGSYCTLKYLVPELQTSNPALQKLAHAAPTFAPLVTIPFLLLAAKQLYDTDIEDKGPDKSDDHKENNPEE